uniref:Large ribosomal subunit protein eL24 n=1 Tax=Leptobrachium leishanense TaxID=445787 RepID=A0A8C5Q9C4_9ANUR
MKVELCSFNGHKIYPGHGRRYVRTDGKVFQFLNAKCESALDGPKGSYLPTFFYVSSLAEIMAKRNQKPEVRKATKKTVPTKAPAMAAPKQKIAKPVKMAAPCVGGKC